MRFRLPFGRRRAPELVAAVALDGDTVRYALVNGPDDAERGKLREARAWPAQEAPHWVGQDLDTYVQNEGALVRAVSAVVGDDVEHLVVTIPPNVADATEAQRQAFAIRSTPWANEDTLAKVGLTVAMMPAVPGSSTYVVAGAGADEIAAARARLPLDPSRVHATTMAPALEALFRATHAGDVDHQAPILLVLANDTYVDTVVLEHQAPVAYAHFTFAELVREVMPRSIPSAERETVASHRASAEPDAIDVDEDEAGTGAPRRVSGERPEGFVTGGYDASVVEPSGADGAPSRRTASRIPDVVDIEVTRAAFRLAMRLTLERYTALSSDDGIEAYATEIDLVFVTGAGVYSYDALALASDYFAHQAAVRPLAAHRITYVYGDTELAERLGASEAAYADVLALLALARRPDMLTLEPYARPSWADAAAGDPRHGASAPTTSTSATTHRGLVVAIVVLFLLAVPIVSIRHVLLARESSRVDEGLRRANERAAALAEELEAQKRDRARVLDNEANNKVIAEAEARNAFEVSFLAAVRAVFAAVASDARLDGMTRDATDGFSLTGTVPNTEDANSLVQALATHGNGAFHDLDLKTETIKVKENVPDDADPAKIVERETERVRFSIRGHFTN